jgi:GH18 family chitinase
MKHKLFYFLLFSLFLSNALMAKNTFRVIGYLPAGRWSVIPQLNFEKLNYVNLSFANADSTGSLVFSQDITEVVSLAHKKKTKVFVSIGGGHTQHADSLIYANGFKPENRERFVKCMVGYIKKNKLDGIDVDFESNALMIPYFNDFVVDLAALLHKNGKQISSAVARWSGARVLDKTLASYDWINMMCYDVTAPWRPNKPGQHAPMIKVTDDYAYWTINRKVDKDKITVGVPFYGYEFVSPTKVNTYKYYEICNQYPGAENLDVINGNLFYNGIPTMISKTEYAYQNAGGIMFWEWGQDAIGSKSLLNAISDKVKSLEKK